MEVPKKRLNIALMGTRGIPARYGGFETFAEELSTRLVARGHSVTVYGRRSFGERYSGPSEYRGVTLRITPTIKSKYLETPIHALTSFLDLFRVKYDVVLLCNAANSPVAFLEKIHGTPLLINVDGIERNRSKWNALGRAWYLLGERASVWFGTKVIADAEVIAEYYREEYSISPSVIAYGAYAHKKEPGETLAKFNLVPRKYLLYVSRLEPENNALGVIEAYNRIRVQQDAPPLVVVGDAPYAKEYIEKLKSTAGPGVLFTGYQFADAYHELQSNCLLYIQATEVGGTHPALIESMAHGNCVVANGTPENIEVLGDAGLFYAKNNFVELEATLKKLLASDSLIAQLRAKAAERAAIRYQWDSITKQYEDLFYEVVQ